MTALCLVGPSRDELFAVGGVRSAVQYSRSPETSYWTPSPYPLSAKVLVAPWCVWLLPWPM